MNSIPSNPVAITQSNSVLPQNAPQNQQNQEEERKSIAAEEGPIIPGNNPVQPAFSKNQIVQLIQAFDPQRDHGILGLLETCAKPENRGNLEAALKETDIQILARHLIDLLPNDPCPRLREHLIRRLLTQCESSKECRKLILSSMRSSLNCTIVLESEEAIFNIISNYSTLGPKARKMFRSFLEAYTLDLRYSSLWTRFESNALSSLDAIYSDLMNEPKPAGSAPTPFHNKLFSLLLRNDAGDFSKEGAFPEHHSLLLNCCNTSAFSALVYMLQSNVTFEPGREAIRTSVLKMGIILFSTGKIPKLKFPFSFFKSFAENETFELWKNIPTSQRINFMKELTNIKYGDICFFFVDKLSDELCSMDSKEFDELSLPEKNLFFKLLQEYGQLRKVNKSLFVDFCNYIKTTSKLNRTAELLEYWERLAYQVEVTPFELLSIRSRFLYMVSDEDYHVGVSEHSVHLDARVRKYLNGLEIYGVDLSHSYLEACKHESSNLDEYDRKRFIREMVSRKKVTQIPANLIIDLLEYLKENPLIAQKDHESTQFPQAMSEIALLIKNSSLPISPLLILEVLKYQLLIIAPKGIDSNSFCANFLMGIGLKKYQELFDYLKSSPWDQAGLGDMVMVLLSAAYSTIPDQFAGDSIKSILAKFNFSYLSDNAFSGILQSSLVSLITAEPDRYLHTASVNQLEKFYKGIECNLHVNWEQLEAEVKETASVSSYNMETLPSFVSNLLAKQRLAIFEKIFNQMVGDSPNAARIKTHTMRLKGQTFKVEGWRAFTSENSVVTAFVNSHSKEPLCNQASLGDFDRRFLTEYHPTLIINEVIKHFNGISGNACTIDNVFRALKLESWFIANMPKDFERKFMQDRHEKFFTETVEKQYEWYQQSEGVVHDLNEKLENFFDDYKGQHPNSTPQQVMAACKQQFDIPTKMEIIEQSERSILLSDEYSNAVVKEIYYLDEKSGKQVLKRKYVIHMLQQFSLFSS